MSEGIDKLLGRTRVDNEVSDGNTITPNYETAALFGDDNGRCPLLFLLPLRYIINVQIGILGTGIAGEFNLVTLINRLPA